MQQQTDTSAPWLNELKAIQGQMSEISEDEIYSALRDTDTEQTVGLATGIRDQVQSTCTSARGFSFRLEIGTEAEGRTGSASMPTS
jgi:hypothetical protein